MITEEGKDLLDKQFSRCGLQTTSGVLSISRWSVELLPSEWCSAHKWNKRESPQPWIVSITYASASMQTAFLYSCQASLVFLCLLACYTVNESSYGASFLVKCFNCVNSSRIKSVDNIRAAALADIHIPSCKWETVEQWMLLAKRRDLVQMNVGSHTWEEVALSRGIK